MPEKNKVQLPAVIKRTKPTLEALTSALGVSRDILASDAEIATVWENLPGILSKVPPDLRTEGLARMCVAVMAGLFDSAINYVWNCAVIELRDKVRRFGLNAVQQVVDDADFDEKKLLDMKDAELLILCLKLNLVTEDGYFFLDHCRDIRNNFSAAHPAVGKIDEHEFLSFTNRCAKHALGNEINLVGVDISAFMLALKADAFTDEQNDTWVQNLKKTYETQRELLFGTLHGLYCDPASTEETRLNAVRISTQFVEDFTPQIKSNLIDRHQEYVANGDEIRHKASQIYFKKLGQLALLSESERHALISNTCKNLYSVHQGWDNFHNEPPFAARVAELSSQGGVPETAKAEFVSTVATCAVGNLYGTSNAAWLYYRSMIQNFSPAEVSILLSLPSSKALVANRIKRHNRCCVKFKEIVSLLSVETVPTRSKAIYKKWLKPLKSGCNL